MKHVITMEQVREAIAYWLDKCRDVQIKESDLKEEIVSVGDWDPPHWVVGYSYESGAVRPHYNVSDLLRRGIDPIGIRVYVGKTIQVVNHVHNGFVYFDNMFPFAAQAMYVRMVDTI